MDIVREETVETRDREMKGFFSSGKEDQHGREERAFVSCLAKQEQQHNWTMKSMLYRKQQLKRDLYRARIAREVGKGKRQRKRE